MSIWFMILTIFIGRFIENDDELAETEELIFEGFLTDEYFHYDCGSLLIYFLVIIVTLLIFIILKDMLKNFTEKKFQNLKKYN